MRGVIVGLGVMGGHHLRVLRSFVDEDVSVVAVVDSDERKLQSALRGVTNCRGYATLDAAVASERLDFACIATPIELLADVAAQALRSGLHVLVEKPMASDLTRAEELVALSERRANLMMVGLVERCNPAVRALKAKLTEGCAGRVMQMTARRLSPFPNRVAPAGVAVDLAVHDIDVMRYLTDAEVKRVYAETATLGDGREDLVCSTLRFDDGTVGLLETNWITPVKVRQLSVTCERGMFLVDYLSQDLTFYENPTSATVWETLRGLRGGGEGDMIRFAIDRWEPLRLEWEGFFAAVRDQAPMAASGADGFAALAIAEAICRSGAAEQGVTVREPLGSTELELGPL